MLQQCNLLNLAHACKLLCVELYASQSAQSAIANNLSWYKFFLQIYACKSLLAVLIYLQHGGVVLCSVH